MAQENEAKVYQQQILQRALNIDPDTGELDSSGYDVDDREQLTCRY